MYELRQVIGLYIRLRKCGEYPRGDSSSIALDQSRFPRVPFDSAVGLFR